MYFCLSSYIRFTDLTSGVDHGLQLPHSRCSFEVGGNVVSVSLRDLRSTVSPSASPRSLAANIAAVVASFNLDYLGQCAPPGFVRDRPTALDHCRWRDLESGLIPSRYRRDHPASLRIDTSLRPLQPQPSRPRRLCRYENLLASADASRNQAACMSHSIRVEFHLHFDVLGSRSQSTCDLFGETRTGIFSGIEQVVTTVAFA